MTAPPLADADVRVLLEDVRPLDWANGEMCEFAMAFTRLLACAGETVPYHTVMGVTGVAFRFTIGPELWNPGFYGFELVAPDVHGLFRRAFSAVGYGYDWRERGDRAEDLRLLTDNLDRGLPVMVRGHLVDASDWVLITGYTPSGDILLGSSPYGGGERYHGHDVIPNWHEPVREYITLGDKGEPASPTTVYAEALRLAVDLVRTPLIGERSTGLRAYDTLVGALRHEAYPAESERQEDTPWFRYLCLLCYNMMLDDHASAPPFLRDAAGVLPAAGADLLAAAECYDQSVALRNELEGVLPSNFSPEAQERVLDPAVREQFAQIILQIRAVEEQGITHIERALAP